MLSSWHQSPLRFCLLLNFLRLQHLPRPSRSFLVEAQMTTRRNVIGPLKKGTLMGYSTHMKAPARHKTLRKVIKKVGPLSTFRKLNAISVLTKRTAPKSSRKMKTDRKWVKKNFM